MVNEWVTWCVDRVDRGDRYADSGGTERHNGKLGQVR